MKPLIGVTLSSRSRWRIYPAFWWAIFRAGGRARWVTARRREDMDELDGLVVGGGDDIGVELYGGEPVKTAKIDPMRDMLELNMVQAAHAQEKPVLGVCRGAQMINVARGGSLHGDIYDAYPGARRIRTPLPRKTVHFREDSRIASICGTAPSRVNALHTQSVDRLGEGLVDAAWDEDGIIQAVEQPGGAFVIGVQWHPELLIFSDRDHALFRALVASAKERQGRGQEAARIR